MKGLIITVIAIIVIAVALFVYRTSMQETIPAASVEQSNQAQESLISNAADNAVVFIMQPGDGSTVSSPLTVKFGITNMSVSPAGIDQPNSGHHHLLIDLIELPDMTEPLPTTDNIVHFGKGQTETTLILEPGEHSLQLLLGNYLHIPHDQPVISKKIHITVE